MFKSLLQKGRMLCLLLLCIASSMAVKAQTRRTGRVIGADDRQPVIGASVRIRSSNTGTLTDVNGNFTLSLNPGDVLVVSYIGYVTTNVTVSADGAINVVLPSASTVLTDVVVTGYQTQRKKDITGAVGTVNVASAVKLQATTSEQLLQGQVSGVTVVNQGAPGSPSTVFVRGITNFGNTTPLYVIDGVQTNNMSQVNPSDIESISVLKDAGAAAIYGVAGGNGVIVVTTKQGKAGKTQLSYDAYYGDQVPLQGNVWHLMNPTQYSQLVYQAGDAGSETVYPGGPGVLPTYGYHGASSAIAGTPFASGAGVTNDPSILQYYHFDQQNPGNDFLVQKFNQQGTDWFHEIFKHALTQSHTVTASGGTDHSTFLYSLQYLDQQGTLIETYEKRYQARVNNTYSILNNHVRFGENGYVFYEQNNGGSSYNQQREDGSISETYREQGIIPVYDVAGNFGGGFDGPTGEPLGNATNPVADQLRSATNQYQAWNIQGTAFAEADLLKHLTFRTAFGGNVNNFFNHYVAPNPYNDYEPHVTPDQYTEVSGYSYTYNWTNTLSYKQTFGKHNISLFGGYELKESSGQQLGVVSNTFVTLNPSFLTVGATTNPTSVNLTSNTYLYQPVSTQSYFARLDYSYADKYLLGATVRRDGYSAFFPGRQYGTFPSISLGWRLSQEDFLKGVSWLNDLKLRGSYGSTGSNANILATNAVDTYNYGFGSTAYGINGGLNTTTTGFGQTSIGNPKTTWETDKILNLGIDLSIINHLDFNIEYYKKSISGLLFPIPLPSTTGAANPPTVNSGDVQNHGLDLAVTYHDVIGKDFRFSLSAYITSYKNKITKLNTPGYFDVSTGTRIGGFVREQVGMPIGSFFGYKTAGIFQSPADVANSPGYSGAAPGEYKYVDVNHDGKIDDNDRTFIGNPNPDFTYGVNANLSYKRFDFSAVFYGSQGNKDFNYVKYWTDTYEAFPGGKNIDLLTKSAIVDPVTHTVTNPGATQTALTVSQNLGTAIPSTFYIENGSFLKLRVASLGYNFDPGMLKNIGITKIHLYVQGTNLFTITKYSGLDPELVPSVNNLNVGGATPQQSASFGVDYGAYPNNQKTYTVGVNMTF